MKIIVSEPSSWIKKIIYSIEPGGNLIDIACGQGRHSVEFVNRYKIFAVDKNKKFLKELESIKNIETINEDLENSLKWSFSKKKFKVVLISNYLFREKIGDLFNLVDIGGYLIYETFAVGNEKYGKPTNPDYLLFRDELLENKPKNFITIDYFFGERFENSKKSVVQRLAAKRIY